MPSAPLLLTAALACATLDDMLPGTAVLDAAAVAAWPGPRPADVRYTGPARTDHPVLPLQVFGVYYDLDVVLVSRHPDWDMHEYARVQTPQGPLWMAKDADMAKVQTIIADHPELGTRIAEVPVQRFVRPVQVEDRTEGRRIDVSIAYENSAGEPVSVQYRGKLPGKPPPKRNGHTMGHSAHAVAVALDLERFGTGGKARIEIDGERVKLDRLLGLYRQRYLLKQAQGGVAVTSLRQQPSGEGGFTVVRPAAGATDPATGAAGWPTTRTEAWQVSGDTAVFDDGWTRQTYTFVDGGLSRATVHQYGREDAVTDLWFDPALPDLSRSFEGQAASRFRMDINGQAGHGTGTLTTWWEGEVAHVALTPDAPRWLADRPMAGTVSFRPDGAVLVEMHRADGP
jgi:hypothetical protein